MRRARARARQRWRLRSRRRSTSRRAVPAGVSHRVRQALSKESSLGATRLRAGATRRRSRARVVERGRSCGGDAHRRRVRRADGQGTGDGVGLGDSRQVGEPTGRARHLRRRVAGVRADPRRRDARDDAGSPERIVPGEAGHRSRHRRPLSRGDLRSRRPAAVVDRAGSREQSPGRVRSPRRRVVSLRVHAAGEPDDVAARDGAAAHGGVGRDDAGERQSAASGHREPGRPPVPHRSPAGERGDVRCRVGSRGSAGRHRRGRLPHRRVRRERHVPEAAVQRVVPVDRSHRDGWRGASRPARSRWLRIPGRSRSRASGTAIPARDVLVAALGELARVKQAGR